MRLPHVFVRLHPLFSFLLYDVLMVEKNST